MPYFSATLQLLHPEEALSAAVLQCLVRELVNNTKGGEEKKRRKPFQIDLKSVKQLCLEIM